MNEKTDLKTDKQYREYFGEPFLKKAALPILAILFVLGGTLFLIVPRIKNILSIKKQNQRLVSERKEFLQKAELIASLDEKMLEENAQLANLALPKEKEISLILYALSGPAKNNNFYTEKLEFSLGEVSLSEKAVSEKRNVIIEKIPVKMSLIGQEKRLASFLSETEETLPLIQVEKVEGRVAADGRITVNLVLSLFLSPQRASYDPEKISLEDLTLSLQEEKLLAKLAQFKKSPVATNFFGGEPVIISAGRENPFVLTQ